MRRKRVTITRCQDCPHAECEERTLCGGIPEGCRLEDAEARTENSEEAGGRDAHRTE